MWALYAREVKRFQKIWMDTIFSPIVSMGLYLAIFGIVAGSRSVEGLNYLAFVWSGLLAMNLVNSSFSNPTFALIISKNVGTIVDLQVVPIKPWGVGLAYALAALTRGVITLLIALCVTVWFVPVQGIANIPILLLSMALTGLEFGMLGVTFGMWAKNFESLTFITTFVMQPMIFLAGVFYPIATLPHPWSIVSQFNPLHHNINLFRYGVTGYSDTAPWISLLVMSGLTIVAFTAMRIMVQKKLRV